MHGCFLVDSTEKGEGKKAIERARGGGWGFVRPLRALGTREVKYLLNCGVEFRKAKDFVESSHAC